MVIKTNLMGIKNFVIVLVNVDSKLLFISKIKVSEILFGSNNNKNISNRWKRRLVVLKSNLKDTWNIFVTFVIIATFEVFSQFCLEAKLTRFELWIFQFCQSTPEGHRAPLADLFRNTRSRSVNTQTPVAGGDVSTSCQSSGGENEFKKVLSHLQIKNDCGVKILVFVFAIYRTTFKRLLVSIAFLCG